MLMRMNCDHDDKRGRKRESERDWKEISVFGVICLFIVLSLFIHPFSLSLSRYCFFLHLHSFACFRSSLQISIAQYKCVCVRINVVRYHRLKHITISSSTSSAFLSGVSCHLYAAYI